MPPGDQVRTDRFGTVKDLAGRAWSIGCVMEDLTRDQLKGRVAKAFCG
jgi:hypothetical protein